MVDFYTRMQGTATRLLNKFKQGSQPDSIVLRATTRSGAANPWNPIQLSSADYPLKAVVDPVNKKYIDNQTIVSDDRMVTFGVIEIEPEMGDQLVLDGKVFEIKQLFRYPAVGIPIYYEVIIGA